jgi:hypothetical protein
MGKELSIKRILNEVSAKLLPDTATHKHRIEIRSETSNKIYIVSKRNTNVKQWECSCKGWIFHRHCKHINAMSGVLKQIEKLNP